MYKIEEIRKESRVHGQVVLLIGKYDFLKNKKEMKNEYGSENDGEFHVVHRDSEQNICHSLETKKIIT